MKTEGLLSIQKTGCKDGPKKVNGERLPLPAPHAVDVLPLVLCSLPLMDLRRMDTRDVDRQRSRFRPICRGPVTPETLRIFLSFRGVPQDWYSVGNRHPIDPFSPPSVEFLPYVACCCH